MDIWKDFKNYLREADKSPLTVKGYVTDLTLFSRWFEQTNGEEFSPQTVTPTDIREYRHFLLTVERRKASTINRRLAALSVYLNWAISQGLIEHNPVRNIRSVKQAAAGPNWLSKQEQYALQRAIEKDVQLARLRYPKRWKGRQRDAALVIFLLNTGLRLHETLNLRLTDIQLTERKGQVSVQQGKGRKQRTVPLNMNARKALQDWLNVRPAPSENSYIFLPLECDSHNALSGRSVQRVVRRLGQDAGLLELSPHTLRHTFAKNLVNSGVSLEKVAALLGHANLNTTRIYITPSQQDLAVAVEQLNLSQ